MSSYSLHLLHCSVRTPLTINTSLPAAGLCNPAAPNAQKGSRRRKQPPDLLIQDMARFVAVVAALALLALSAGSAQVMQLCMVLCIACKQWAAARPSRVHDCCLEDEL
jgi:hypothetical protein